MTYNLPHSSHTHLHNLSAQTHRRRPAASRLAVATVLLGFFVLIVPATGWAQNFVLQSVQFPEDRDVDVEFSPVHTVPGTLTAEVEYENGNAEVRFRARDMEPALALGGDVSSYVAWAVSRSGQAERFGELPIFDGDERTTFLTDLKDFAILVTLEEHPQVPHPSSLVAFQNLPTDDSGAKSAPLTYTLEGAAPRIGQGTTRLRLDNHCEWQVEKARKVYQLAESRQAGVYAPERLRDARVAMSQAENFLEGNHKDEAIDYAQRSVAASADALNLRSEELMRQAELAEKKAEEQRQAALEQRAEHAEQREENLEDALDTSERSRLTLQQQVTLRNQQLAQLKSRETQLVTKQQQAQQDLDKARDELKALDMDRTDARARADALMQERARLSRVVGELSTEKQGLETERQELIAQQADLQQKNEQLARQKAEAEAERERLAKEKAAVVADLYGTLSQIADTKQTARGLVVSLPDILFDFDKSTLKPEGTKTLAKLAGVALLVPELEFSIEGHTDAIGSESYNDWLSRARANSVADFLAQEGVSNARMETAGFGEDHPVATNDTDNGRQKNRRVEVVIDKDSLPGVNERKASLN